MKPQQIENRRYEKADHNTFRQEEAIMVELLKKHAAHSRKKPDAVRILDIGCGTGGVTEHLVKLGYKVKGLDFSEAALKKARAKGLDVSQCDLDEGIPEPSGQYDIVWAGDIVEHVFDPINLLKEAARVLKKRGVLLLTIPSDVGLITRIKTLVGISHQEQVYRAYGYYKHHTFFSPGLIKFMLGEAKLTVTEFERVLIIGPRHFRVPALPAAFFNEMVIAAKK